MKHDGHRFLLIYIFYKNVGDTGICEHRIYPFFAELLERDIRRPKQDGIVHWLL